MKGCMRCENAQTQLLEHARRQWKACRFRHSNFDEDHNRRVGPVGRRMAGMMLRTTPTIAVAANRSATGWPTREDMLFRAAAGDVATK